MADSISKYSDTFSLYDVSTNKRYQFQLFGTDDKKATIGKSHTGGAATNPLEDDIDTATDKIEEKLHKQLYGGADKKKDIDLNKYVSSKYEKYARQGGGGGKSNPAFEAHIKFVAHIREKLKITGGSPIPLQKLASMYKKEIKDKNPDIDSITLTKKATESFDKDSKAKEKYDKIVRQYESEKGKKKEDKQDRTKTKQSRDKPKKKKAYAEVSSDSDS